MSFRIFSVAILWFLLGPIPVQSQQVHSLKTWEQSWKQQAKPALVFLHTDWCKICHANAELFEGEEYQSLMDSVFYLVSFNPETARDVEFFGRKFQFLPQGQGVGTHEFVLELLGEKGVPAFPCFVYLDEEMEVKWVFPGYLDAEQLRLLLEH